MTGFSTLSKDKLSTCHPILQEICHDLIKKIDFTVICGYRNKEDQDKYFEIGASKLKFPNSKHNTIPSLAIDIAPYPINWNNHVAFKELATEFKKIANNKGVKVIWGGDWEHFKDLVHYELNL